MLTFYLCFLAGGVVFVFISFFLGSISGDADAGVSSDIDVNADISMNADISVDTDITVDSGNDVSTGTHINPGTDSFISIGLIPTSFLSISALAIIFGVVGALMTIGNAGKILTFIFSAVLGYIASVIVQTMIKSLKRLQTDNSGIDENELLLYDGKVVDTILPGQMGTVSFLTLKKERVSYPALCIDRNLKLKTGRIVKVKEFKNGIFIVEPKNPYE